MLNSILETIVKTLLSENDLFEKGFIHERVSGNESAITDEVGNYFYLEVVKSDSGDDYSVSTRGGDTSGFRNVSGQCKLIARLTAFNPKDAAETLIGQLDQMSFELEEVSVSTDSEKIHLSETSKELETDRLQLLRITFTVSDLIHLSSIENCRKKLCITN